MLAERLDRRRGGLFHRTPPLQRDQRLDARVAALARADRVAVRLALLDELPLLRPRDHAVAGVLLREPGEIACGLAHEAVPADRHGLGQPVVAADVEVERIVTRRHLQRARPELAVDPLVGDHEDAVLEVRDEHLATDRVSVARIVGMDRDRDVGEDRRRPHRRDGDAVASVTVRERVADRVQRVVHLLVHDLEIRDRRLVERAPVDDAVRPVDPAALP